MTQLAPHLSLGKRANYPEAGDFPKWPATWYLFGRSRDLSTAPVSKTILARRLVAFRDSKNRVTVMDAHCSHLGADLGRGTISGDTIRCPFHHWKYDSGGQCVSIPNTSCIPDNAKLRVYPTVERHGYVFFFFGPEALFPLPFYADLDPNEFLASEPFQFHMDSPWVMLVGNGFDGQHFQSVHDRRLTSPPRVDCPEPYARRMRFDAEIIGTSVFDRLLKRFVSKEVQVSITSWGGPYVLVEGIFRRAHSRLLVASQPLDESNTLSDVIVFARKGHVPLASQASLRVRRRFTQAFLQYDIEKLAGVRYQPAGLTEQDHELAAFFRWVAQLPTSEYEVSP